MAAHASDLTTASATSQELQLFPELVAQLPVVPVAVKSQRVRSAARPVRQQSLPELPLGGLWQFEGDVAVDSLPGLGQILLQGKTSEPEEVTSARVSPSDVADEMAAEAVPEGNALPPVESNMTESAPQTVEEFVGKDAHEDVTDSVEDDGSAEVGTDLPAADESDFPEENSFSINPETATMMPDEQRSEALALSESECGSHVDVDAVEDAQASPFQPVSTTDEADSAGLMSSEPAHESERRAEASVDAIATEDLAETRGEPTTDEEESLAPLPKELHHVAAALEKSMNDPLVMSGAFAAFCSAAYVKPEWAGVASDFLAGLFEDQQDVLAEMTRVPDLIIELGTGHYTLTFMVASRWAARVDMARLTRLAEALVAAHSKFDSPEVVDLMLALTTSLAISRYPRAEQLLNAAESHVGDEHRESLEEAHLWLGGGRIVRSCNQEVRDLWDVRLRRPRTAWGWTSPEECEALNQLSICLDTRAPSASLFQSVVPACWWALQTTREQETEELEKALQAAKAPRQAEPVLEQPREVVRQPVVIWRGIPFFIGGLVGAWALLLGISISPYDLVRVPPLVAEAEPGSPQSTGKGNPAEKGATVTPSPESPAAPEHPNTLWRREQVASLAKEVPELRPLVEKIEFGEWAEHEALLEGLTLELPRDDPKYQKLLLWLLLDPPSNAEIRKQVPFLLASLRQDSTVIELWEKLVYPGSLNARDIQEAAMRTQHDNKEAWSPTQRALLTRIGNVALGDQ